jgi:hypothetical protein
MHIVFGKETAKELREKYTVLELEEIETAKGTLEPYCVIPVEKMAMALSSMQNAISLHEKFVQAIKDHDTKMCIDLHEHLIGKFGGELDSFYDTVAHRCKETGSVKLVLPETPES